jgi:hypothetical protein
MAGGAKIDFLGLFVRDKVTQEKNKRGDDAETEQVEPSGGGVHQIMPVALDHKHDQRQDEKAQGNAEYFCNLGAGNTLLRSSSTSRVGLGNNQK